MVFRGIGFRVGYLSSVKASASLSNAASDMSLNPPILSSALKQNELESRSGRHLVSLPVWVLANFQVWPRGEATFSSQRGPGHEARHDPKPHTLHPTPYTLHTLSQRGPSDVARHDAMGAACPWDSVAIREKVEEDDGAGLEAMPNVGENLEGVCRGGCPIPLLWRLAALDVRPVCERGHHASVLCRPHIVAHLGKRGEWSESPLDHELPFHTRDMQRRQLIALVVCCGGDTHPWRHVGGFCEAHRCGGPRSARQAARGVTAERSR